VKEDSDVGQRSTDRLDPGNTGKERGRGPHLSEWSGVQPDRDRQV
jgi:hypothetical protein